MTPKSLSRPDLAGSGSVARARARGVFALPMPPSAAKLAPATLKNQPRFFMSLPHFLSCYHSFLSLSLYIFLPHDIALLYDRPQVNPNFRQARVLNEVRGKLVEGLGRRSRAARNFTTLRNLRRRLLPCAPVFLAEPLVFPDVGYRANARRSGNTRFMFATGKRLPPPMV